MREQGKAGQLGTVVSTKLYYDTADFSSVQKTVAPTKLQ